MYDKTINEFLNAQDIANWAAEIYELSVVTSDWAVGPIGPYGLSDWGGDACLDSCSLPSYAMEAAALFIADNLHNNWADDDWQEAMDLFCGHYQVVLDDARRWFKGHNSMYGKLTICGLMIERFPKEYGRLKQLLVSEDDDAPAPVKAPAKDELWKHITDLCR